MRFFFALCVSIVLFVPGMMMVAGAQENESDLKAQAQELQQKMIVDKEIMGTIMTLQNDPDFQMILQDPEIMKAINAGDLITLISHPKFVGFLNKAAVRDAGGKPQDQGVEKNQ